MTSSRLAVGTDHITGQPVAGYVIQSYLVTTGNQYDTADTLEDAIVLIRQYMQAMGPGGHVVLNAVLFGWNAEIPWRQALAFHHHHSGETPVYVSDPPRLVPALVEWKTGPERTSNEITFTPGYCRLVMTTTGMTFEPISFATVKDLLMSGPGGVFKVYVFNGDREFELDAFQIVEASWVENLSYGSDQPVIRANTVTKTGRLEYRQRTMLDVGGSL